MNLIKKRGVVLELSDSEMILLTAEGEFVRRPVLNNSVVVGQEICYSENVEPLLKPRLGAQFLTRWRRSGLAVAVVLLLLLLTPTLLNQMPMASETVAYVTIDVNPSIGLGIDNKNTIVSSEGLNKEGADIISAIDVVGMSSENAVKAITEKIIIMGFIKQDEAAQLMITIRPVRAGKNNKLIAEIEQKLSESTKAALAKDNVKYTTVASALIDEELRISAQVAGVSPGRYLMMLADIQQNGMVALGSSGESNANENTDSINLNELEETPALDTQMPVEQETPNLQKSNEQLAAVDTNPVIDTPNTRPSSGDQQDNSSETNKPRENQNSLAAANLPTPVAEIAMFIDGELAEEDDEDEEDELNSEKEDKDTEGKNSK